MNANLESESLDRMKSQTEGKVDGIAQDFAKNVKNYSSTAVDSISSGYESALGWVKRNPLQAAAIGAGVGFLIGAAIRRFGSEKSS